jgi:hypothetical protein
MLTVNLFFLKKNPKVILVYKLNNSLGIEDEKEDEKN